MKNNPFTHEEINLMSIYNAAGTREGLIAALTEMRGYSFRMKTMWQSVFTRCSAISFCPEYFHETGGA